MDYWYGHRDLPYGGVRDRFSSCETVLTNQGSNAEQAAP